ncbi:MAG: endospore germination permease [Alicyclobacillus sp.]|nr:endospore germination permease [Alicyclobacillus sp.]
MHVQISRLQLITMLIWTVLGTGVVAVPAIVSQFTVQDAWMIGVLFFASAAVPAFVCSRFVRAFPDTTLVEALCQTFGPLLGRSLALWYMVWLYIALATIIRELSGFVTAAALPKTPDYVVSALAMFVVAFLVRHGTEVLGRMSEFITPLAMIIVPILVALTARNIRLGHFLPVLADGWSPVWQAALVPCLAYAFELTVVLQMVPSLRSPQTVGRDIFLAAAVVSALLTITLSITIGVEGPVTSYLSFPILEVVRSIRIGRFIERLDTLYVMGVVSTLLLKLAVFHYAACEGWKSLFKLQSMRFIVWNAASAAWAASSLFFRSSAEVMYFILYVAPAYVPLNMVLLPMLAVTVRRLGRFARRLGHIRNPFPGS